MQSLSLHEFHQRLGAQFAEVAGMEAVMDYGPPLAEYAALRDHAGLLDLSLRGRICLTGADRTRFLHGQVTNDVKGLRAGEGCYAALITAKGKMQSDLFIYCLKEELLLDFEPGLTQIVSERLEKHIIADDVQLTDVSAQFGLLSVQGPKAAEVVRALGFAGELPARPGNSCEIQDGPLAQACLANNPRLGTAGFDLFVPAESAQGIAERAIAAAGNLGGRACGWRAFELARIERAIPRFGLDMDDTNIPLEAGLKSRAVSFNKGCYIGQEVISRIQTYGQVAKALRALRFAPELRVLPAKGDRLFLNGKEVGYITSAVESPSLNARLGLGYVRKEANQVGTELVLRSADQETAVKLVGLPFGET